MVEDGAKAGDLTSVTIEDRVGCPRYLARVIEGVTFGTSPALVRARLTACGVRPLGNLIDATNYVLLLTGQPLHAFDLDKLAEQRIVVRRARDGERLNTLDGEERALDTTDLVIADATRRAGDRRCHGRRGQRGRAVHEARAARVRVLRADRGSRGRAAVTTCAPRRRLASSAAPTRRWFPMPRRSPPS